MPWLSRPEGFSGNEEDLHLHFFDDEAEQALRLLVAATAILDPDVLPPEPEDDGEAGDAYTDVEPEDAHGDSEAEDAHDVLADREPYDTVLADDIREQAGSGLEMGAADEPFAALDEHEAAEADALLEIERRKFEEKLAEEALKRLQPLDDLASSRTELMRLLIQHALEGEDSVPAEMLASAQDRLDRAIDTVAEALDVDRAAAVERADPTFMEDVAQRLRELGLEEKDASLHLIRHRDGKQGIAWNRIPPETAHVWLLGSLYDRVERSLELVPLLELERRASHWYFLGVSAERRGGENLFAQGVREQEWSLVDRPTLVDGVPVLSAFCEQGFFPLLPARQQAVARALRRSFVGVFTVRAPRGEVKVFESLLDGRRYEVHEHNPAETHYSPGALALGRLIPWEGGLHLRSPGMVIVPRPHPDLAPTILDAMNKLQDAMPPSIALEGSISAFVMGSKVPRQVRPAASRAEARELLDIMPELFEEYDLVGDPDLDDKAEVPEEFRRIAERREVKLLNLKVDAVMGEWIQELHKLANAPPPSGAAARSKKGKRGKQKRKKRR